MCASHNGEPVHLGAVRALLERAGLGPDALRTPPPYPLDADEMARSQHRHPLFSDCSGKHAGMLLACARSGWSSDSYVRRSHPLQRRVLRAVERATGVDDVRVGVDGCGRAGARRGAASDRDAVRAPRRARASGRARAVGVAARSRPCWPSPTSSAVAIAFDTALMQAVPGIVAKEGAEALLCVALPDRGFGIALKVADAGYRAAGPAMIEVLSQLDALDAGERHALQAVGRPTVRGGDEAVGAIEAVVTLRRR